MWRLKNWSLAVDWELFYVLQTSKMTLRKLLKFYFAKEEIKLRTRRFFYGHNELWEEAGDKFKTHKILMKDF